MEICKEWRQEAMAYLDNELPEPRRTALETHLAQCPTCARVLQEYKQMSEITQKMRPPSLPEAVWDEFPKGVFARLSRGLGWVFYIVGILLIVGYGLYQFVVCPGDALPKIAVFSILVGLGLLFLSVLKNRYDESKTDRYSKEVYR